MCPQLSVFSSPQDGAVCYSLRAQELIFFLLHYLFTTLRKREICETPGPTAQLTED